MRKIARFVVMGNVGMERKFLFVCKVCGGGGGEGGMPLFLNENLEAFLDFVSNAGNASHHVCAKLRHLFIFSKLCHPTICLVSDGRIK